MGNAKSPIYLEKKSALQSKTIWGCIIALVGTIAQVIVDNSAAFEDAVPGWAPTIVTVAGIILAIHGRFKAIRPIQFILLLSMVFLFPACATAPPVLHVEQDESGQSNRNTGLDTTTLITGDSTYTDASKTGFTAVDQDKSGMNVATHGPATASALDLEANRLFGFSGGDFSVASIRIEEHQDGSRIIDIQGVNSTASEVIRASNEGYDRLVAIWSRLSEDQREAVLETLRAQVQLGGSVAEVASGILDLLTSMP